MKDHNDIIPASPLSPGPYLIISGHDYRTKRKVDVHFIASNLSQMAETRFFSLGFSLLSRLKGDPRIELWNSANVIEDVDGVKSYLHKTWVHPFNISRLGLPFVSAFLFRLYKNTFPKIFFEWIRTSSTILVESGISIVALDLIREVNPTAKVIYLASDSIEVVGLDPCLNRTLMRNAAQLSGIRTPSLRLAAEFPDDSLVRVVSHGINPPSKTMAEQSPYPDGINIVSVGSTLIDPQFFHVAATVRPDINFYIIGGGHKVRHLKNANIYIIDEMRFADTLPYITHADAGVAAYIIDNLPTYMADTSMKLMQYDYYGLPSICPRAAAGDKPFRFAYSKCDGASIAQAINGALDYGRFPGEKYISWPDVTNEILELELYRPAKCFV